MKPLKFFATSATLRAPYSPKATIDLCKTGEGDSSTPRSGLRAGVFFGIARTGREEVKMNKKIPFSKLAVTSALAAVMFVSPLATMAQGDLIPVSDIAGGSGVFVLRAGGPKKFVTRDKSRPSRTQRREVAKRVSKQYVTLAKKDPRRVRTTVVTPDDPRLKQPNRMSKEEATKVFAGVGEYFLDRDDYNQATMYFREALTMDAANTIAATGLSEALALKGNELLVQDMFPAAKNMFDEALKYNPKNAPAYFGLAEVLTEMSQQSEAADAEKAKQQEAEAAKNYELALENDKELSEIYTPLGTLYYRAGEVPKAESYLTKAVTASPNDPQANYFLGLVRYTQNNNEEALKYLRKASTLDATNAEVFFYLGETLSRMGKHAEAVVEYEKATKLRENYFEAWLNLGAAQYQIGTRESYLKAVEALEKAVRLKNDNYEAFNNLGDAYRQTGNYNKAESNYGLAALFIQKKPGFSKDEAAGMHSKAAFSIAKQCELNIKQAKPCRWADAVRALEAADKLSSSSVDAANLGWAYYNAARVDLDAKRMDAARPNLEKAKLSLQRAASGNSAFASGPMLNLGMALADLGEYPAAIDALTKVIDKEPKWVFAINELGMAYYKKGDYKEATAQFKRATDKDGKFAQGYFNLAMANFKNGNLGDARKNWDTLKKLGQSDANARSLAAKLDVETNGGLRAGS